MSQVLSEFGKLIGTSANNIQVAVMPQASTVDVGTIVQYIGATDANYTNGYFYKCVSDGQSTPAYSWEEVSVQSQSEYSATFDITLSGNGGSTPYSVDKTPAEVEAAITEGQVVRLIVTAGATDFVTSLKMVGNNSYLFSVALSEGDVDDSEIQGLQFILTKGSSSTWSSIVGSEFSTDIASKADKVESATSGNFAGLDANGNLTDSGSKASDFLTQHQDITGKADKVTSATNGNFAGLDANGNLTDSGSKASDFLTQHQDITGKADKVSGAINGNFASLDANGNLADSGHKHSDYLTSHQDISGKADKVSGATNGNLAKLNSSGNLVDAGVAASALVTTSKAAASGGTALSLVTTGEKATWNAKTSNTGTVTSVVASTGLNGGTITTSGTLSVKYGTAAGTACQGNDSRLSNARTANGGNADYVRTFAASGGSHGDSWLMTAQHNKAGDGCFRIYCGDDSVKTSVYRCDYGTYSAAGSSVGSANLKNIYAGTADMTAGSSALTTGNIYLVYE